LAYVRHYNTSYYGLSVLFFNSRAGSWKSMMKKSKPVKYLRFNDDIRGWSPITGIKRRLTDILRTMVYALIDTGITFIPTLTGSKV